MHEVAALRAKWKDKELEEALRVRHPLGELGVGTTGLDEGDPGRRIWPRFRWRDAEPPPASRALDRAAAAIAAERQYR
jgi:hypothetical protein